MTHPSNLDPNRDYPVDKNVKCYQVTATHIIDFLFRKYQFDLTVMLHNGASQIGYNWGTLTHQTNSHTVEYDIYKAISEMMQN